MSSPSGSPGGTTKRGKCAGWTSDAARRNRDFLRSVRTDELTGHGVALTLTIRELPGSAAELASARDVWIRRQKRRGLVRLHWVTEWQRRGVPHLHCAAYYGDGSVSIGGWGKGAVDDWLELVAEKYGAHRRAQHGELIDEAVGWLKYVAKHAARGAGHYQRQRHELPPTWQSAGRMWGKVGKWPRSEPGKIDLPDEIGFRLRRFAQAWELSHARRPTDYHGWHHEPDGKRIAYVRGLRKHKFGHARCTGLWSTWCPAAVLDELISAALYRDDPAVDPLAEKSRRS